MEKDCKKLLITQMGEATLKISIVIPVHNGEKTIHRCLDSIFTKPYPDLEVVVVNDHSTDATVQILEEYASRFQCLKVLSSERDGVSAARNVGLQNATGEVVGFCDADDMFVPDALEHIFSRFLDMEGYDLCCFGYETISYTGESQTEVRYGVSTDQEWSAKKFLSHALWDRDILGSVWNKFFKRTLLENVIFDEDLCYCEDMHFLAQVAAKHPRARVFVMSYIGYHYIQHEESATHSVDKLFDKDCRLHYNLAMEKILTQGNLPLSVRWLVKGVQCRLALEVKGQFALNEQQKDSVAGIIRKNWVYYPCVMCNMPIEAAKIIVKSMRKSG